MDLWSWFATRLKEADLVNLGVIFAFAILLGVGGVVAMSKGEAVQPLAPLDEPHEDEKGDKNGHGEDEDRGEGDDDDEEKGGRDGKGNGGG